MEQIYIKDEYIRLGQALKLAGLVGSGVDAKFVIKEGLVSLNGEKVYERGKKCRQGDVIEYDGAKVMVNNAH
ncbi:MAG: RNA-binding S4 domain-containing protein [Lachnospiraceae bacterium]|jgi:conserved hypothetical protein